MRDLLLWGHISFAMIWIGSQIGVHFLSARIRKASPDLLLEHIKGVEWLGNRVQGPAALLVLLCGIGLVIVDEYGFTRLWILLGIVGFVVVMGIAGGYLVPQTRQILRLAGEHGLDAPDVQAKIASVLRVSTIDSVLMILIVLDMVAKPTL
ncbi:DUF2269 family protein [Actinocrispum sp. NPDC049592]|uniref:DUF2269 family protein n=1 Tax=Actinocrispum sp. NPDC049592 TaxID=3154835 RepID=UPI003420EB42